jgi:hypothetical protein
MSNIRGILHGIDSQPAAPRIARKRSAQERQEEEQGLSRVVDEHIASARADMKRHTLAQILNELPGFWASYTAETEKAWRTPETRATYKQLWEKYRAWTGEEGLQAVPVSAEAVSHFLIHEGADGARPEKLKKIVSALRFYQGWLEPKHDEVLVNATLSWLAAKWFEEDQEKAAEAKTETQTEQPANIGPAQH